ncbi:MAG: hydrogen peroxide-inducible genes activator [Odoribacteraceae bacterium]|jgi:LysR family hydrogen peroxide-inducible transcriptional activator|nr:hydrogen peroxide-inducible genes activator [Odoribacteraceae bacterium]
MTPITITQLAYIVAVDDHRNFSTAADHCCVTQPTLSMQIKKLEDDLGVTIFDRSYQPVIPTDLGARLIEQARLVLASTRRLQEIINEDKQEINGTLRLGIIPTLAPYLLPAFISRYTRQHPKVRLEIEELPSAEIITRLKRDTLDAAIFVTPYRDEKIITIPILYENLLLYAHPDHQLLRQKNIDPTHLDPADMWILGEGHCFRDQTLNLCQTTPAATRARPFTFEGNSIHTLLKIVDAEGGFTIIPQLAARELPPEKQNQLRPFNTYNPTRETSIIYSRHHTKHKLIALLREELRAIIPPEMQHLDSGSTIVEWQTPDTPPKKQKP